MELKHYGYDAFFEEAFEEQAGDGMSPGRVTAEHRGAYTIVADVGEMPAEPTGKLRYFSDSREDLPAVGDWVLATVLDGGKHAVIHGVLPRRTALVRKEAGVGYGGQVIAANVDRVFIVQGLDGDFNPRRIERYLVLVREGGAAPVVLMSKSDLLSPEELSEKLPQVERSAGDCPVIAFSAVSGEGIPDIRRILAQGTTVCFVGSSGAGKSTLINALAGKEILATAEVRAHDSRGRHTTTSRQMLLLPEGGIVIDTPGMREVGLISADGSSDSVFPDIAKLAESCRFADCSHTSEPGCAVIGAIEAGELDESRFESYHKLRREAFHAAAKHDVSLGQKKKKREKKFARLVRSIEKTDKRRFEKY